MKGLRKAENYSRLVKLTVFVIRLVWHILFDHFKRFTSFFFFVDLAAVGLVLCGQSEHKFRTVIRFAAESLFDRESEENDCQDGLIYGFPFLHVSFIAVSVLNIFFFPAAKQKTFYQSSTRRVFCTPFYVFFSLRQMTTFGSGDIFVV